jgi:hypothetical protein
MKRKNEIYNPDFTFSRQPDVAMPDGWLRVGGSSETNWQWRKKPDGTGEIHIINPSPQKAGIRQQQQVFVPVAEKQRWLFSADVKSSVPQAVYINIHFLNPAGYPIGLLALSKLTEPNYSRLEEVVATPCSTSAAIIEIGLAEPGEIIIEIVSFHRLYPRNKLRLDDKGRVFVSHVAAIEEIRKPLKIRGPIDVNPVTVKGPLDVEVTVDSNIRNLVFTRDSVSVFGSEGVPLKTNQFGLLQVEITGGGYTEETESVQTANTWKSSTVRDVSLQKTYSFATLNTGSRPAILKLRASPDKINWLDNKPEETIQPGEMKVLAFTYFLRYATVSYRSAIKEKPTSLTMWYQAQS